MLTILTIEDNPIWLKSLTIMLEVEGYKVLQASDGKTALEIVSRQAPDLILLDLILPDMGGFEILAKIRATPHGTDIPIFALTGFLSQEEEAKAFSLSFDYLFVKPIDRTELLKTIKFHLTDEKVLITQGNGKRILIDDDPVQLKLGRLRLEHAGFIVSVAKNAKMGLDDAYQFHPDAILSDVMMPEMDGFRFCTVVRQDPLLAKIPIVLMSASYLEEEDQKLAKVLGANALVARTPDFAAIARILEEVINAALPADEIVHPVQSTESKEPIGSPIGQANKFNELGQDYLHRQIMQLERQVGMNKKLMQRCSLQAAALSVQDALAHAISSRLDFKTAIHECLHQCLNTVGLSTGAIYLYDAQQKLQLAAQIGLQSNIQEYLYSFFGNSELFSQLFESRAPIAIPSLEFTVQHYKDLLVLAGARTAVFAPIYCHAEKLGVFVIFSTSRDLSGEDWCNFAQTVALQVGQAVNLGQTFSELSFSEQRRHELHLMLRP